MGYFFGVVNKYAKAFDALAVSIARLETPIIEFIGCKCRCIGRYATEDTGRCVVEKCSVFVIVEYDSSTKVWVRSRGKGVPAECFADDVGFGNYGTGQLVGCREQNSLARKIWM